jgi:thiamine biosynthesis lipoprotein
MRDNQLIMGMPITVEIVDGSATVESILKIFDYFKFIDEKFSTYKTNSEISKINRSEIKPENYSEGMKEVLLLSEETKNETKGYFNISHKDLIDPSGLVKGWAINKAAILLLGEGFENFYVEAGGDIQTCGKNSDGKKWSVGIKNPFDQTEIIKVLLLSGQGIATSGNYIRGEHIYNPFEDSPINEIVSLTVIGPNVYEADRFATAAFAMGKDGINFIEERKDLEGYVINKDGIATMTSDFEKYCLY